MLPDQAFGLPKGTVRGILAILATCAFLFAGIAAGAVTDLKEVAVIALSGYFISKAAAR